MVITTMSSQTAVKLKELLKVNLLEFNSLENNHCLIINFNRGYCSRICLKGVRLKEGV